MPAKRSVKVHPDAVKAAALAAYDTMGTRDTYAIKRAAEITSLPFDTVRSWIRKGYATADQAHLRRSHKREIADRLEETIHSIIDEIPAKLDTAPLNQLAIAMAISIDKRLLLLGQPNSIGVSVNLSPEQRARRLDEIFSRHDTKAPSGNDDTSA